MQHALFTDEYVNPVLPTTARRNRQQYYDLNLDEIFRFYSALYFHIHTRRDIDCNGAHKGIRNR